MYDIVLCGQAAGSDFFSNAIRELRPRTVRRLPSALRLEDVEAPEEALDRLRSLAETAFCDVFVLPAGFSVRNIRLFCFDMDSTLTENEVINDMGEKAGVLDEMRELTRRAMSGEIGFHESLRQRVALLKGQPVAILEDSIRRTRIHPGAHVVADFARRHGIPFYVISGGFIEVARAVGRLIGASGVVSNELVIRDGMLTGEVTGPGGNEIIDVLGKRRIVQVLAQFNQAALEETLCCGDGANDIEMIRTAGVGVACHAKPVLDAVAGQRIHHTGLESIPLFFREAWHDEEPSA